MEIERLKTISYILNSENKNETFEIIRTISNEDELFVLLDNYNWDNGFEVPTEILSNPHCTVSKMIHKFWKINHPEDGFHVFSQFLIY